MIGWGDPHNLDPARAPRLRELDRIVTKRDFQAEPRRALPSIGEQNRLAKEKKYAEMRERQRRRGELQRGRCSRAEADLIFEIAKRHDVPFDIVTMPGGGGGRQAYRARLEIAQTLRSHGYSFPRIGACLGVHHTSIIYMLKRSTPSPPALPASPEPVPYPDLSGEWAI
jgi:hypothetical protein